MFSKKFILVKLEEIEDKRILFKLSFPKRIKKYFSSNWLYAEYSVNIGDVNKSILYVPAVSSLISAAWAIDADIYVEELDRAFLEALEKVRRIKEKWHPHFSFKTQIRVKKIVQNKFGNTGHGLLFSGGIDSTASYIRHRQDKIHLIFIWGLDILPSKEEYWRKTESFLKEFSEKENVKIHFIKTNARQIFFEKLLSIEFGLLWWERVSHGLVTLGLCAPITAKENIGTLLIASSGKRQDMKWSWGSHPATDNLLRWADVKVIHDSDDMDRQEKIRYLIKPYVEKTGYYPTLRVCTRILKDLNCNECEKCLRTITELVLENIDPNKCGFTMNSQIWHKIKNKFINREFKLSKNPGLFLFSKEARTTSWEVLQRAIPEKLNHDLYNCEEFFEWFKAFNLERYGLEMENKIEIKELLEVLKIRLFNCLATLYYSLPKTLQQK